MACGLCQWFLFYSIFLWSFYEFSCATALKNSTRVFVDFLFNGFFFKLLDPLIKIVCFFFCVNSGRDIQIIYAKKFVVIVDLAHMIFEMKKVRVFPNFYFFADGDVFNFIYIRLFFLLLPSSCLQCIASLSAMLKFCLHSEIQSQSVYYRNSLSLFQTKQFLKMQHNRKITSLSNPLSRYYVVRISGVLISLLLLGGRIFIFNNLKHL